MYSSVIKKAENIFYKSRTDLDFKWKLSLTYSMYVRESFRPFCTITKVIENFTFTWIRTLSIWWLQQQQRVKERISLLILFLFCSLVMKGQRHETNVLFFYSDNKCNLHNRLVLVEFNRHILICSKQTSTAASQFPFNISVALGAFEGRHP